MLSYVTRMSPTQSPLLKAKPLSFGEFFRRSLRVFELKPLQETDRLFPRMNYYSSCFTSLSDRQGQLPNFSTPLPLFLFKKIGWYCLKNYKNFKRLLVFMKKNKLYQTSLLIIKDPNMPHS